jgi:hypothetical protein
MIRQTQSIINGKRSGFRLYSSPHLLLPFFPRGEKRASVVALKCIVSFY